MSYYDDLARYIGMDAINAEIAADEPEIICDDDLRWPAGAIAAIEATTWPDL